MATCSADLNRPDLASGPSKERKFRRRIHVNTKLYVGGLSYETTDDELRELFSSVGTVQSAEIIRDRYTGRSRGFGFVEMGTPAEAEAAISTFNGTTLGGREIIVAEAKPRRERSRGYGNRGGRW